MVWMRQVLVPTIFVSKGHDETMGESIVQLLRAGIPAPFEILDEWQAGAQIPECRLDELYRGLGSSVVELEQHNMPINTVFLCHKNLLVFALFVFYIHYTFEKSIYETGFSNGNPAEENEYVGNLMEKRVDGLVLFTGQQWRRIST